MMKWKHFFIGVGIGAAAVTVYMMQKKQPTITSEKALKIAKAAFKETGPVNGSWIHMEPEQLEKDGIIYSVYKGGISRPVDGHIKQYDFTVDADTGDMLETALRNNR